MARALFAVGLLVAFEALGRTYEVQLPAAIDLATGARVDPGKPPDLSIEGGQLRAPRGIKLDGRRELYRTRMPLVLAAPLLCRAAGGRQFQVMVVSQKGDAVTLEVSLQSPVVGSFEVASMAVDGVATPMPMQPLRLKVDGTYDLGGASGWTDQRDGRVALDGAFLGWGRAQVTQSGEMLIFRFRRAHRSIQLMLQRRYEGPEELRASL